MSLASYGDARRHAARRQWALVGGVCAAAALGLTVLARITDHRLPLLTPGTAAPPLVAADLGAGRARRQLADFRGQVVLLDVWATWCESCKVGLPDLERLQRAYGPRGLRVMAVSVDALGDSAAARATLAEVAPSVVALHDPTERLKGTYRVRGLPTTFLIDRQGRLVRQTLGVLNPGAAHATEWTTPEGRAQIEAALATPGPSGGPGARPPGA